LRVHKEVFAKKMSYNIYSGALASDFPLLSNPNTTSDCHYMAYKCFIRSQSDDL